jgi:hypothetical protein
MIAPLSNRRMGLPSVNVSVKAGMRPLGLISRNHGSWIASGPHLPAGTHVPTSSKTCRPTFCVFLLMSMAVV